MRWTENRETKRTEDRAYCLLGVFNVYMPLMYGEGDNAFARLREEIWKSSKSESSIPQQCCPVARSFFNVLLYREEGRVDKKGNRGNPMKQIRSSIASFGYKTQDVFMSDDRAEHRSLATVYLRLAEHTQLLQEVVHTQRLILASTSCTSTPCERALMLPGSNNDEHQDSKAVGFFVDCVSRFSQSRPTMSIDRLHAICSGSPDYLLEKRASFFPEQYTLEVLVGGRIVVNAMVRSQEDFRKQTLFLTYAKTPRQWRRTIVSTSYGAARKPSAMWESLPTNDTLEHIWRVLPKGLEKLLDKLFSGLELVHSVTRLAVPLDEDGSGQLLLGAASIVPTQDLVEAAMADEDSKVQDVKNMGCGPITESEVVIKRRISSSCYSVLYRSHIYLEEIVPFATSGPPGSNAYDNFFSDLKRLKSLLGCEGVPKFAGVVLDDTQRQLRGFLYESPSILSLEFIFTAAKTRRETIGWPIREFWARKIVEAVALIHERTVYSGNLRLSRIGLRADGTPLFTGLKTMPLHQTDINGNVPPEHREAYQGESRDLQNVAGFRTDIFQLGFLLWLLAEHTAMPAAYFCEKAACTNVPRFTCNAEHRNPVQLPACGGNIPSYISDIVGACRSPDPRSRPTARELVDRFHNLGVADTRPAGLSELVEAYSTCEYEESVYCDECNEVTTACYYHCNICHQGDFDICSACFEQGTRCFNFEHHMVKMIMKNGILVDGS